jgi:hypothetical protein
MSEPLTSEAKVLPKRAVLIAVLKHYAIPNLDSHEPRSSADTRFLGGAVQVTPGFGVAQQFTAAIQATTSDGFSRCGAASSTNPTLSEL